MNKPFGRLFLLLCFISFYGCAQSDSLDLVDLEKIKNIPKDSIYPSSDIVIATHTDFTRTHYQKRIIKFKQNPLKIGDIVFLGNSITEQGSNWGVKVRNSKARNRGIAGDTTEGVLARIGELVCFKPSQVFILIGINDLFRDDVSAQRVHDNIINIVNEIHNGTPETKIFVQTILPTTTETLKPKIEKTNTLLKNSSLTEPFKLISLHDEFVTENNVMNMTLSTDGVHLNDNGYLVWIKKIKNLIKS